MVLQLNTCCVGMDIDVKGEWEIAVTKGLEGR